MLSEMLMITIAVLVAAVLHASWNAVAKALPDGLVTFAALELGATACAAVALPFVPVPAGPAWPWLVASTVTHNAYNLLLMRSYRLGPFNQAYPLARGTGPLVVAAVGLLVLHETLHAAQWAGVVLVGASLVFLSVGSGTRLDAKGRPAVFAALLTGLAIAGYTIMDGIGVRHSGTATGYAAYLFLLSGPAFPVAALVLRRGRLTRPVLRRTWPALLGGLMSVAAYGLVIWAQSRGALAAVAALRECSVVVAAVIGVLVFRERLGRSRILASIGVAAGVILISIG
jgi:drug/metabolite transporter (DMT)-like permease